MLAGVTTCTAGWLLVRRHHKGWSLRRPPIRNAWYATRNKREREVHSVVGSDLGEEMLCP